MAGLWSVALRAMLGAVAELGLDAEELRRRSGIDAAHLADPDGRIPMEQAARVWPEGARLFGRPGLGLHAGAALRFGMLEALDYAFATAPTVAAGLSRTVQYFDVVSGGGTRMLVERREDAYVLVFLPLPLDDLRDYGLAASVQRLRWAGVAPGRIQMRGAPVAAAGEYAALLGCPVEFNAQRSAVELTTADAARPMPTQLPGLREVVDRDLSRILAAALVDADPLNDVRREILGGLGGQPPTLADVARRLGVSDRTLQRRLSERSTTFKQLLDEVRLALAREHLQRDRRSVAEVAFSLGYSEPSAFSRAFHRWTGEWPADFRTRARAEQKPGGSGNG